MGCHARSNQRPLGRGIALFISALITLAATGCGTSDPDMLAVDGCSSDEFIIDLDAAWDVVAEDDDDERVEQLRDWTWTALAARLEQTEKFDGLLMSTALQPVIRDQALAHALDHPVGPVRAGTARSAVTVVMVEQGRPADMNEEVLEAIDRESFLIGQTPLRALVYHYVIDAASAHARVCRTADRDQAWIKATAQGFRPATVRTAEELERFLAGGVDLLSAECTSEGLKVTGRQRRRTRPAPITVEHIAALWPHRTRPYREQKLRAMWSRLQLFGGLPPGQPPTETQLAERAAQIGFSLDPTSRADHARLDRAYQCARYDGPLQGTLTGMTFFYTDLLMKLWYQDHYNSAPEGIVPGFVSIPSYSLEPVHCAEADKYPVSELHLGLRKDRYLRDRTAATSFAPVATKLYGKGSVHGPAFGEEVEQAELYARLTRWSNARYGLIASWEPQYELLNQILKWSAVAAAVDLADRRACLAILEAVEVTESHRFDQWVKNQPDLRWNGPVNLVKTDREATECIPMLISRSFAQCGSSKVLSGGVLGQNPTALQKLPTGRAEHPPHLGRLAPWRNAATMDGQFLSASSLQQGGRALENVRIHSKTGRLTGTIVQATSQRSRRYIYGFLGQSAPRKASAKRVSRTVNQKPDRLTIRLGLGIDRLYRKDIDAAQDQMHVTGIQSKRMTIKVDPGMTAELRAMAMTVLDQRSRAPKLEQAAARVPAINAIWRLHGSDNLLVRMQSNGGSKIYVVLSEQGPRGPPGETVFAARYSNGGKRELHVSVHEGRAAEQFKKKATAVPDKVLRASKENAAAQREKFQAVVATGDSKAIDTLYLDLHPAGRSELRKLVRKQKRALNRRGKDAGPLSFLLIKWPILRDGPAATSTSPVESTEPPSDAAQVFAPVLPPGPKPKPPKDADRRYRFTVLGQARAHRQVPKKLTIGEQVYERRPDLVQDRDDGSRDLGVRRSKIYLAEPCAVPGQSLTDGYVECASSSTFEADLCTQLHSLASQLTDAQRAELATICERRSTSTNE
ncbi:MAG: hypothetical protein MJE77_15055 [Proteobacteria bacterium]|nr:hypothetical protein [Pseudomonadota bacterium]